MQNKLMRMGGAENSECHLMSLKHGTEWTCIVEASNGTSSIRIHESGATPEEAVDAAFVKWSRFTSALPEFDKSIGYTPFEEVPSSADDDIPF